MTIDLAHLLRPFSALWWLTGPIFDKELRVSSRRRRNYVLRFVYVAALSLFVVSTWYITLRIGGLGSAAFQASRIPELGKRVVTSLVWFQFIAAQAIAVVSLSSSISSEIQQRTLGLLMTTPVNSLQIVVGKLSSKLLQLVLLLAISLPLLAIVRVFGGVPWDYVVSSLCITLTAAIFAGALSLAFSIYNRQAHLVIVRTVLVCFLFYIVPPIVLGLLRFAYQVRIVPDAALYYVNPLIAMRASTERMLSPSPPVPTLSWPLHCATMAGVSALLLALSIVCVRRVGLRQATEQAGMFLSRSQRRFADGKRKKTADSPTMFRRIRRVKGPPILWKKMMTVLIKTSRLRAVFSLMLAVFILAVAYGYCAYAGFLGSAGAQMGFILVYFFFGLFRTATSASTSITSEKEARTWPILLATPLTERQIVFSEVVGSCLGGWAFWLLLVAHIAVFGLARYIPPAAILPLVLLVVTSALLVSAVGVFFSSCFARSSTSACINLILFLWFTVPICQPLPASPLFAAFMIIGVTSGWHGISGVQYEPRSGWGGWLGAFLISGLALIVLVTIYLALAFAALEVATSNVRRRRL